MTSTDRLVFLDSSGRRILMVGWDGDWPPPQRLWLLLGGLSGDISVVDPERAGIKELLPLLPLHPTIRKRPFRLRNASKLPEAFPEDAFVFRGAEYVPETDDA